MFWLWFSLLILSLAEGLHSLYGGRRQFEEWRRASRRRLAGRGGKPAAVILPCRGLDQELEQNLEAFFGLENPDFQLLFVVESQSDPVWEKLARLQRLHPRVSARILVAGPARGCGQKVHNLRFAVERLPETTRSVVLADSDIRPLPDWLEALTGALDGPETGLATGFRWYLPPPGSSAATILRSAWNAGILSLLGSQDSSFGWGGALACSRRVFDECEGRRSWEGSLSDDYSLSAAVRAHGYKIRFVPRALSLSPGTCSLRELAGWSTRQMAITRIYHPTMWRLAWVSQLLYGISVWVTPALILVPSMLSGLSLPQRLILGALGLLVAGLSAVKARHRLGAVAALLPERSDEILRYAPAYGPAAPLSNLVTLQALARSLFSRKIEWRGIGYEMVSPRETRILFRSEPE